jgi:hypothetical protein
MTERFAERVHERTAGLLPWYANGTLADQERQAVEAHLAGCVRCQQELAECRSLQTALNTGEESLPSPHPVQLARLLTRIDAETPGESHTAKRAWRERVTGGRSAWFGRQLPWVIAAQLLLVLGAAALVSPRHLVPSAARFITLSQRPEAPSGPEIRIVFADNATAAQVRDLLLRVGGHLTDGPSPVGAYTVQVTPAAGHRDPVELTVAYLRSQPIVRFAQPVAGAAAASKDEAGRPR